MCLGRMAEYSQPQIYLNGITLQGVNNARHLGNIFTSQLKDDMGIQLTLIQVTSESYTKG